jgi:hypothetical protein
MIVLSSKVNFAGHCPDREKLHVHGKYRVMVSEEANGPGEVASSSCSSP